MFFLPLLLAIIAARYLSDWYPYQAGLISFLLGSAGMAGVWALASIARRADGAPGRSNRRAGKA